MRGALLKAAATGLTVVMTAAAALYVGGHLKNPSAPLQPPVPSGPAAVQGTGGRLSLTPSVKSAGVAAVTSTYAS